MKSWAFGLLLWVSAGALAPGAWGRPDPDPAPPPQAPAEAPLRPTDRRDLFTPALDLLILVALAGWLWMLQSRRRREESLFRASVYDQFPAARLPLRAVTYPSGAQAEALRRYRAQWIEEFCSLQNAWALHDLKPVEGMIGSQVRTELEGAKRRGSDPEALPELTVRQADPADSWQEDDKEYVTVHFSGVLREAGETIGEEFDEYWTFSRDMPKEEAEKEATGALWVVTAIRRGTRERSLPRLAHHGRG